MTLQSINPHDQSVVGETAITSGEELSHAVEKARTAFISWKRVPLAERASYIKKLGRLYESHKEELAQLTSKEVGKPLSQARDDVDGEIEFINWYAGEGIHALDEELITKDGSSTFSVHYEPYGVVACIAPWNFPLSMFDSGTLPALIAGNTVLFKPSEYTTLTQKFALDLLLKTGIPDGVVQCIVGGKDVGKALVDSNVDYVWFTGSTVVGKEIYKKCADKFIKCALELGGSSPGIVFADHPDDTIDTLFWARYLCSGQVCSAIKRLFVEKSDYALFVENLKKRVLEAKVGNPLEEDTIIGPLVAKIQLEKLESQVKDAIDKGAQIVCGGNRVANTNGNYFEPTILINVAEDSRILHEEVFGPVLPILSFETEEEVISLANKTEYGLSAEIYTKDLVRAERMIPLIDAGAVAINTDSYYKPMCPIGGYKSSGIGREYGRHGMQEFAQVKLVALKKY
jgi:succinate-semialdehyde dehydrogenase/glutarate-semialdehyde dehydrogenase